MQYSLVSADFTGGRHMTSSSRYCLSYILLLSEIPAQRMDKTMNSKKPSAGKSSKFVFASSDIRQVKFELPHSSSHLGMKGRVGVCVNFNHVYVQVPKSR